MGLLPGLVPPGGTPVESGMTIIRLGGHRHHVEVAHTMIATDLMMISMTNVQMEETADLLIAMRDHPVEDVPRRKSCLMASLHI